MSEAQLLPQLFGEAADRAPRSPAVTVGGTTYDYASLAGAVATRAADLGSSSVRTVELDEGFASVVDLLAALTTAYVVAVCGHDDARRMRSVTECLAPEIGTEPSVVFPTSGSSGEPKLVCHSHRTLSAALDNTLELRREQIGDEATLALTVIPGMPLWSISGFNVLELTLFTGGHLVMSGTAAADVLDAIERYGVTNIGVPPIMLRALVREQRRRPRTLESLLLIGIGAGPVDPALAREVENAFGCNVATAYGSTEIGGAALMPRYVDPLDVRTGSVGRALPGIETAVDGRGELRVRSNSMMRGYITAQGALTPHPRGSWYSTGDLANVDDAGNWHVIGRLDDQILRGGRLIDPRPIEATLARDPTVDSAAVVGIASRVPGEQDVWAAYTDAIGAEQDDGDTRSRLRKLCHDALPPHNRPRRIVRVDEIPLRRDGSPHRPAVRELLLGRGEEVAAGGVVEPVRDIGGQQTEVLD